MSLAGEIKKRDSKNAKREMFFLPSLLTCADRVHLKRSSRQTSNIRLIFMWRILRQTGGRCLGAAAKQINILLLHGSEEGTPERRKKRWTLSSRQICSHYTRVIRSWQKWQLIFACTYFGYRFLLYGPADSDITDYIIIRIYLKFLILI